MSSVDRALRQLGHVLGPAPASAIVGDCLRRIGVDAVGSADELMRLAECLMQKGGIVEIVGRALKMQALKQGARLG